MERDEVGQLPEEGWFLKTSYEDIVSSMQSGYLITARLLHFFSRKFLKRGHGKIVVIGPYQGITLGLTGYSLLSSDGSALWGLCESIRDELKTHNISLIYYAKARFTTQVNTSIYVTPKVDNLFKVIPPATQSDILMDGITAGYYFNCLYDIATML